MYFYYIYFNVTIEVHIESIFFQTQSHHMSSTLAAAQTRHRQPPAVFVKT